MRALAAYLTGGASGDTHEVFNDLGSLLVNAKMNSVSFERRSFIKMLNGARPIDSVR